MTSFAHTSPLFRQICGKGLLLMSGVLLGSALANAQVTVNAHTKPLLEIDQLTFKDLNDNAQLDPYEDWRLPVAVRVEDLLSQMSLEEKAGMLLIDTLNAERGGELSTAGAGLVTDEKMTRFIFRNTVTATPDPASGGPRSGPEVTAREAAQFMNQVQELAESTRLGIPVVFKSNARNHYERDARTGINVASGVFSEWPKEAGLAATRDMDLIAEFAQTMRQEWTAIGLRGMYGYMADLSTEPRWYRVHETFSEDADLVADIMTTLVSNLQGETLRPDSVALTMKHFPGGGPQENGGDPHYPFGKNQAYPTDNFDYHLKPFRAAIAAGVSAIMPYYGIPVGQDWQPNNVGMAFSKGILTDLLRDEVGFTGYVNSDTGIIGERAWGLEDKSVDEQILISLEAGIDVLSGFSDNSQVMSLVNDGRLTEARLDVSVRRLLTEQFQLGLFENPFVNVDRAADLVGNAAFQERAQFAQRKSIVLLENRNNLLPLAAPAPGKPVQLYTMGMNPAVAGHENMGGYTVVTGDYNAQAGESRPAVPADTDYAILRIDVNTRGTEPGLFFGGANPDELDLLAFSQMPGSKSWTITPSLDDIRAVMAEAGAERTTLAIYFRQPYVLDSDSGLRDAGATLATFGVNDAALMDVLTGRFQPAGKLPFALANKPKAIVEQAPDAPGYEARDTLFPFGHGLSY